MRRALRGVSLLLAIAGAGACAAAPDPAPPVPIAQQQFAPETEVQLARMTRHARGFYWRDVAVGDGRQGAPGLKVQVAYVVRLPDGREVDRAEREQPVTFTLGQRQGIVALELALRDMKEGGVRQLVVPPELAYGVRGRGPVPPNATLVMVVALVKVG